MKIILLCVSIGFYASPGFAGKESNSFMYLSSAHESDVSDIETATTNTGNSEANSAEVTPSTSTGFQGVCTRKDQTSIPQKVFLRLFKGKPKSLNFNRKVQAGTLTLSAPEMVYNCNSMLEKNFSKPKGGMPYTFEVGVKMPKRTGTCAEAADGKTKCEYEVQLMGDDGQPKDKLDKMSFEPNYYGFLDCLEKTGITANGKWNEDKIVYEDFNQTERSVNQSGKLVYYCKGYECKNDLSLNRQKKTLYAERANKCQHFEDIIDGGYEILSKSQVSLNNKTNEFQMLCKSKDYRRIDRLLPSYKGFGAMYKILEQIRDKKIIDAVKVLHKKFKGDNYSKFNPAKVKDLLKDFNELIIEPLRQRIELYIARGLDPSPDIEKLRLLVSDPHISLGDYDRMLDFAKKAPLHKKDWRQAALLNYRNNITAYHMSRYHPEYAEEDKLDPDYSLDDTADAIEDAVSEQKVKVKKIGMLASNKKYSVINEYKQNAADIDYRYQKDLAGIKMAIQEDDYELQTKCDSSRLPQYAINQVICQNIAQHKNELYGNLNYYSSDEYKNTKLAPQYQEQALLAQQYSPYEAARNKAFGIKTPAFIDINRASRVPNYSGTMNYANTGQGSNDPYARYLQQLALQRQQQQQQGNNSNAYTSGMNNSTWGNYNNGMPASNFNAGAGYQGQFQFKF